MEAKNEYLKAQLSQYHAAFCSISQALWEKNLEIAHLKEMVKSIVARNKATVEAIKVACLIMPINDSEL